MTDLDSMPFGSDAGPAVLETPRKCHHPRFKRLALGDGGWWCWPEVGGCGHEVAGLQVRKGRTTRSYGNRAELAVARTYGGTKIGHAGGPVDVRGAEFNVQVKTHRRLPPAEWRRAFAAMSPNRERIPRLLLRFLPGPGLPPDDYFVIPGKAWLDWFGKDEGTPDAD